MKCILERAWCHKPSSSKQWVARSTRPFFAMQSDQFGDHELPTGVFLVGHFEDFKVFCGECNINSRSLFARQVNVGAVQESSLPTRSSTGWSGRCRGSLRTTVNIMVPINKGAPYGLSIIQELLLTFLFGLTQQGKQTRFLKLPREQKLSSKQR